MGLGIDNRQRIARRAAQEVKDGMVVNLGIGIPSLIPNYLPSGSRVMFHAENGILGMGPTPPLGEEEASVCNAAGYPVTTVPGASFCDSSIAFAMIRRGLLDMTVLGALEVSEVGDLANWIVPGKRVPGMGGAVDLAQKAKKVVVLMNHCTKTGEPKIVKTCRLPLTAKGCVQLIITDRAVVEVKETGLLLTEIMSPYTVEQVISTIGADVTVSSRLKVNS